MSVVGRALQESEMCCAQRTNCWKPLLLHLSPLSLVLFLLHILRNPPGQHSHLCPGHYISASSFPLVTFYQYRLCLLRNVYFLMSSKSAIDAAYMTFHV